MLYRPCGTQKAGGPYKITITSHHGHVILTDVIFGDVWACCGQSNMVSKIFPFNIDGIDFCLMEVKDYNKK